MSGCCMRFDPSEGTASQDCPLRLTRRSSCMRFDPSEGTASYVAKEECFIVDRCIRFDPSEGTARYPPCSQEICQRNVALGSTRLRVLQVAVLPDRGHDAAVALGSTRLRVLQVYALIAWHTDLSVVALGSTRLRVLQERL